VRLELTGVFRSSEFDTVSFLSQPRSVRLELVLGSDADGQLFTLHKLDLLHLSRTSAFRVSYLLVGRHFFSPDEIMFGSALIQYTHLEAWSCYQLTRSSKSATPDFFSLEVPTGVATLLKASGAGAAKELSLDAYTSQRFTLGLVELKPSAHFSTVFAENANLRAVFAFGNELGQFMTMLVGEPSYVKKVRLFDRDGTAVEVFYPSTIRAEGEIHPLEMCFPLPDIANVAPMLVKGWFASLPTLEPVYDLLFGTLFGRDSFVRTKFLSLTQAIESFHRRAYGGTYASVEDFTKVESALKAAVPTGTPDPLKQRISDSIRYANEYSLRKRIKEVLQGLAPATTQMLKLSDAGGCADLLVRTRNYLTHFDEQSRTMLVDDIVAMHYMNERLTALLFILVLKRLGLAEDTAAKGSLKRRFFQ
jgi:ApeA N-terminal domain 1